MHARVRELIDHAALCGFTNGGLEGRGHYRLTHPNGETMRVAASPGDCRGDKNARSQMHRLSGVTPPRPKSGKYKRGIRLPQHKGATELTESVSRVYDYLAAEHRSLCDDINTIDDRATALDVVNELEEVEQRMRDLGRTSPARSYRWRWV